MSAQETAQATPRAKLRPFIPAQDFALSKRFYEAVGFHASYQDESIAIYEQSGLAFILQNYDVKDFAENCMMQWLMPDLESWWVHRNIGALPDAFSVKSPRAPESQAWGGRVGFIWDPSGVLWQITQMDHA